MNIKVFKSIIIGGTSKENLLEQLNNAGILYNDYAHMLFQHPSFTPFDNREGVEIVKVDLTDLGLSEPSFYKDIVSYAANLNLNLCPLFLGAYLRLEYLDQPKGPYLTVASEKPTADEHFPNGLYLRNFESSLWLRGYRASEDFRWPLKSEFIFMNNRKN